MPVSLMEISCDKPLDHITTDERRLAQTAVDYLLHLGHQRLAYCGLDRQWARNQEMRRVMRSKGLTLEFFIEEAGLTSPDSQKAEEHLDAFFRAPHPPTAVFCFGDNTAMQLLLHAQRRGLRVPGDLSILGCGNARLCDFLTPALTSIEQFPEEIGRLAFALIQRRRREGMEPGERKAERVIVPPSLVIRESCGPPEPRTPALPLICPGVPSTVETPSTTHQETLQVDASLRRLLQACRTPATRKELMNSLGLHDRVNFRRVYLVPALQAGYLERTIPDKPHSSRQRYRLTVDGEKRVKGEE